MAFPWTALYAEAESMETMWLIRYERNYHLHVLINMVAPKFSIVTTHVYLGHLSNPKPAGTAAEQVVWQSEEFFT